MNEELAKWIVVAFDTINSGVADKLSKDNVTIYKLGKNSNIVRIDIKTE